MNVVVITEQDFIGKINKNNTNMRTDYAWIHMLDAVHVPYHKYVDSEEVKSLVEASDLLICIPSKKQPVALQIIHLIRKDFPNKKIAVMQEGPASFWQDWDVNWQMVYIATITKIADVVLCHNKKDKDFFLGYTSKPVIVLPTTNVIDNFKSLVIEPSNKVEGVFIGGNFCKWYNGASSYFAIRSFPFTSITLPSMGRKQEDEEDVLSNLDERIQHLPYTIHSDFMSVLSKHKYAIHLMPTLAAGSFYLNCAILGIPCIGSKHNDVMKTCFPELCVDPYDVKGANELMKKLMVDKEFYEEVRKTALEEANKYDVSKAKLFIDKINSVTTTE